jgi:N-acetylglucosamine malate deacetylase 1
MFSRKKILFVGSHTDDVELGAGATLSRAIRDGAEVFVIVFSIARASVPSGKPETTLKDEFIASMQSYGLTADCYKIYDYPVRLFPEHRQRILENLLSVRSSFDPDIIFTHCRQDVHQDHKVVSEECVRAFKNRSILGYELIWNNFEFEPGIFIEVSTADIDSKLKALNSYKSQVELARPYFKRELSESAALFRGIQCGRKKTEAFEVIRMIINEA